MENKKQSILKKIIIFTFVSILILFLLVSTFAREGEISNWYQLKTHLKSLFFLIFILPIAIIGYFIERALKKKK